MALNTAAAVITFASRLESESAKFYRDGAARYKEARETFLFLAQENEKIEKLVKQTYYGVISDALEACFSFEGLNEDEYLIQTELPGGTGYTDMLKKSIDLEEKIQKFYQKAGALSKGLLPDVPRALEKTARKREERKLKLNSLLSSSPS